MAQPVELFVYDTLLDQRRMKTLCGDWDRLRTAMLPEHALRFVIAAGDGSGAEADLRPAAGETVYGVVYSILPHALVALRRHYSGRALRRVTVRTGDGPVPADTFVAIAPEPGLRPTGAYIREIEEGMRQHGFSGEVIAGPRRWAGTTEPAPGPGRGAPG